ncbi:uncharacterized protein LOC134836147 isoform X1 [Culicoides brevitarsis]|uniref:uncharacterized protein LOC134836147 isoform X1 n=1 Tax=Culicoides brevitarsis TaxID=469753 RepID=UPI00307C9996
MFKQHLQMIGYNETPNKKAKFWQSYVRSLKGSDDIRAQETSRWDRRPFAHLFEDHEIPHHRILVPGYRYLPVHRETYGYSPRPIYPSHYRSYEKLRPVVPNIYPNRYLSSEPVDYSLWRWNLAQRRALLKAKTLEDTERAMGDHLKNLREIEHRYPSRYGLYLRDRPHSLLPQDIEYEPETKPY